MNKWFQADERTEATSGRLAFIVLGLTQIGLYLAIVIQRYVMDRPSAYYDDLAVILALSFLGYWLPALYLGGTLPTMSRRAAFAAYVVLVLGIAVPHTIVRGWPTESDWWRRFLVYFVMPGVLLGVYGVFAYLGGKRMERLLSSDEA